MSNTSKISTIKVMPYCQDAMSSCGLFAWGDASGTNKYEPKTFIKPNPPIDNDDDNSYMREPRLVSKFFAADGDSCVTSDGSDGAMSSGVCVSLSSAPPSSGGAKVSADTITAGLGTATALIGLLGNKKQLSEVEAVCGKQPKPLIGGVTKKAAWNTCATNYMQSKANANRPKQGMSGLAIAGIGVGLTVLFIGGYLVIKNMKPKQVVAQTIPVIK